MSNGIKNFNVKDFVKNYWQQSPLLIRNALEDTELISPDELASLALEPEVESRIIVNDPAEDSWELKHGPFDEQEFTALPKSHWTLLVQAVDHWSDEIRNLQNLFRFLPRWRIDDIMVSYATHGGGVGPHYDFYDVFLIQGSGSRVWRTGQLCNEESDLIDQLPVKVLSDFQEQDRWVMEPGDMLYIPPGFAHWGEAIDDSITYSIGFRAPSESEFISDFGHFLSGQVSDFERYSDKKLHIRTQSPHELMPEDIARLKKILNQYKSDDNLLGRWLGQYMTEPKYDDAMVDTGHMDLAQFIDRWHEQPLFRNSSSRMAYFGGTLFADGQGYETLLGSSELTKICDLDSFSFNNDTIFSDNQVQELMWQLFNAGVVFFDV